MPPFTALLDACVLVPISLADSLLRLAEKGLYRPLWSERILTEAQYAAEKIHPDANLAKRFARMRSAFEDAMVTGWENLESGFALPDEDDRHVAAAALRGGAQTIVTANLSDFPSAVLSLLGLEAVHPDAFLLDLLDLSPSTVLRAVREQAAHAMRPPLTPKDLASVLGRAGVPGFAAEILRLMSPPLGENAH
jgi:hypothetical protein